MKRLACLSSFLVCFCGLVLVFTSLPVVAAVPYYEGKTVEIIVPSRAGGGDDTITRIIAKVMPRYIPGRPTIVVRNVPGGGSAIANNIFYEKAIRDGRHLLFNSQAPFNLQLSHSDMVKFNLLKYKHIGNINRGGNLLLVRKPTVLRLTDPKAEPVVCGVQEGQESWLAMVLWGGEFLGWNIHCIPGYSGSSDQELAIQRGENDIIGSTNAFMVHRLVKEGIVELICQMGSFKKGKVMRRPDFPDAPTFLEKLGDKKPTGIPWKAYLAWVSGKEVDKFLSAPPGTPDKYVSVLVDAFEKMGKDPEFDTLVKKMVTDVYVVSVGQDTADLVRNALDVPKESLDYIAVLLKKYGLRK